MTAQSSLARVSAEGHQFIEAGPSFSSDFTEAYEYSGIVPTETFDHATYFAEFLNRSRQLPPAGAYKFRDVDVTGAWMLLSRRNYREIYSLPGMGWTQAHIAHVLADEESLREGAGQDHSRTLAGKYVLLSCPGAFTFGHVLVDISLRIQLAKTMGLCAGVKFLVQSPVQSWYLPFLSIAGISIEDCVLVGRGDRYRVEEVYVPTLTGVNGILNRSVALYGFRRMKEAINNILGPKPNGRTLIFPLHTTMSSMHHPRGVVQRDAVVETLHRRFGIEAFDPLQLSFAEQVTKFREARLVLGEDSSALHNVLWSDAADLVVLAPVNYFNYYHIGIQAVNGGRTAVVWGEVVDEEKGAFQIDLNGLCRTLDDLLRE